MITGFAIWFGMWSHRAGIQKHAVNAIEEVGGRVIYKHEIVRSTRSTRPVFSPPHQLHRRRRPYRQGVGATRELPGPAWLRNRLGDHYFIRAVRVELNGGPTGDAVTDETFAVVATLPHLEQLHLHYTNISAEALSSLQQVDHLKSLHITCPPNLFEGGDAHLSQLAKLATLERLELVDADFDGGELGQLQELPRLTALSIVGALLSIDDLRQLKSFRRLTYLELSDISIDEDFIDVMCSIPQMKNLRLRSVNLAAANKLQAALVNCNVTIER